MTQFNIFIDIIGVAFLLFFISMCITLYFDKPNVKITNCGVEQEFYGN